MTTLKFKHLKRYKDLVWLLVKYGQLDIKDLGSDVSLPDSTSLVDRGAGHPEDLAKDLQQLGPTFVKLGQLLSTQTDILPEAYADALSKLQDQADPFPYEEVEKMFQEELGVKVQDIFKEFNPVPLAAGSLAQVHYAILPSDRVVAVKVQRPRIREGIIDDLEVLEEVATFLEKKTAWAKRYGILDKIHQLRSTLINELDYRQEARNLVSFKRNLRDFPHLIVPSPIPDYTTSRILTMDFVSGQKITKLSPLITMELDGEKLAEEIFRAYLRQILIDGLVHIDPHPGNVYLSQDDRIILLDLGMVARISPQMQNGLLKLLLAISEGQGEEAADIIARLGRKTEDFNDHQFSEEVSNLVAQYQDLNLAQMSMGKLMLKIAGIAGDTGLVPPPTFNMLGKALLNLDRVGKTLAPHFNPNESIRENASELLNQRMRRNFSWGIFYRTFIEAAEFMQRLPSKLNDILNTLAKNELKLNVNAIDEKQLMIGFEKVANRITLGLVLAALIIGASQLMKVETAFTIWGYPGLAMILFLSAAFGGVLLMVNILTSDEKQE
jgi:ubiquinone biosynthesis protein